MVVRECGGRKCAVGEKLDGGGELGGDRRRLDEKALRTLRSHEALIFQNTQIWRQVEPLRSACSSFSQICGEHSKIVRQSSRG